MAFLSYNGVLELPPSGSRLSCVRRRPRPSAAGGLGIDLGDEACDQSTQGALVQGDEQPGPDEPPKEDHCPGDEQVLIDREARQPCGRMTGDVATHIEGEEQHEAEEPQEAAEAQGVAGPTPVAHPVVDGAGLREPKHELVEADVDGGPPVSGVDPELPRTGFGNPIVGSRMRLSHKQAGRHPVVKRLYELGGGRPNRDCALNLRCQSHSGIGWRGRLTPMHPSLLPRAPAPPRCIKNTPWRRLYRYHARAARGRTSDTARITRLPCGSRAAYRSDRARLDAPVTRRQVIVHN